METYLREKELLNIDPSRIFNTDETALLFNPKATKILTMRGNKNVYNIVNNFLIFSYNQMPYRWSYDKSYNSWMTGENFYEYVGNLFHL